MKRLMTLAGILAAATAWAGCGNSMNNNIPYDDGLVPPIDGAPGTVDAPVNGPDAAVNGPDAGMNGGGDAGSGMLPSNATIFTIVLENNSYSTIVGDTTDAPYINNTLIKNYGLATNYSDDAHPSLPNYVWMDSGSNYGITTDYDADSKPPLSDPDLGGQLQKFGVKWRSYQESMSTACQTNSSGNYAPKHNPFLYFTDIDPDPSNPSALCKKVDVPFSNFMTDLGTNSYRYMWITPNLVDDGHNASSRKVGLQNSDAWLKKEVPNILMSDGYKNGGVLFITWDEAEGGGDHIPMIIISPNIKSAGYKSNTAYDHSSYLATVEDLLGLPRLGKVKNSPSMEADFLK